MRAALDTEIVMVFGGDGTFLRAAELARYTDAALMGVNLGTGRASSPRPSPRRSRRR